MARRFYISGLGAGTSVFLPQSTALSMLDNRVPSISTTQLLSAMQREQARISANEDPPIMEEIRAGAQSDVPGVSPGVVSYPTSSIPSAPPMAIIGETDSQGRGIIYMPTDDEGSSRSGWSDFWRMFGPPLIAGTGLLTAVFLLTRKRGKRR